MFSFVSDVSIIYGRFFDRAVFKQLFLALLKRIIDCCIMDSDQLFAKLNEGLLNERLGAFRNNVEKNLPLIKTCGGLSGVVPLLRGRHIFIAGAGPSIEESLPFLKKYQFREEIAIIAADMALKALLKHGIRPGYVISCETRPAAFFAGVKTENIRLLAFSCISPTNLRSWKGQISFFNWMKYGEPFDELWEKAGIDLGFAATASIVTTQAVSIALGCSPASIVLLGNDLGFKDRYYAAGTEPGFKDFISADRLSPVVSLEMNKVRRSREYEIRRGANMFYTNNQFLAAKKWLEQLFKEHTCPVYDCSIPGCSESSVMKADIKKILQGFDRKPKRRGK